MKRAKRNGDRPETMKPCARCEETRDRLAVYEKALEAIIDVAYIDPREAAQNILEDVSRLRLDIELAAIAKAKGDSR